MRKRGFKLIRKTPVWLHRIKGKRSLQLADAGCELSSFRLFGETAAVENSQITGVGDYDPESNKYLINLKSHGRNLISGKEFFTIHKNLGISPSATIDDEYYTVTVPPSANGTMIIDNTVISFKENKTYTLCAYMWYVHTVPDGLRNLRLAFEYSDGTSSPMTVVNSSYKIYVTARSISGKTVVGISSYADKEQTCRIGINSFGIFEGYYSSYDTCFEPYEAKNITIALDEPLLTVGYSKDELDLLEGTVTRRNRRFTIDGESDIERTDRQSEFRIRLPEPMMNAMNYLSSYPQYDPDAEACPVSVYPSDDGEYIHIIAEEGTDIDSLRTALSQSPLHLAYPLAEARKETVPNFTRVTFEQQYIDVCTSIEPKAIIAEYL